MTGNAHNLWGCPPLQAVHHPKKRQISFNVSGVPWGIHFHSHVDHNVHAVQTQSYDYYSAQQYKGQWDYLTDQNTQGGGTSSQDIPLWDGRGTEGGYTAK